MEWLDHFERLLKVHTQVSSRRILDELPRSAIDRTVEEIVESERLYVSDLKIIMDEYVDPLMAALAYNKDKHSPANNKRFRYSVVYSFARGLQLARCYLQNPLSPCTHSVFNQHHAWSQKDRGWA